MRMNVRTRSAAWQNIPMLVAALLLCLQASAQTPADSVYTLEQCVEMALNNNRKTLTARNEVQAAVNLRKEAFTKYFPEISAAGLAFWANHDILQYNLLDIIELGIIKNGKSAGVQLLQPVFTGGQIYHGNKLAELGEDVARLRQEQTANDLRLTTETLYWKLMTLEATKGVVNQAITTLDSLSMQVKAAVNAGLALYNDQLKVELKKNTYKSELVDLDNGIKLVKMLLGQYMGLGIEGNLAIDQDVPAQTPPFPAETYISSQTALPSTPDYRLLEKNVEAKVIEKKMEIGSNLPTVAFGAGWYYHDLLDQNHNFGALQIGVEIPLSAWWGASYSIKRKDVAVTNARLELEDLSEELQIQMQEKWNNVTAAHRKMEIEQEGITQSLENLRLSRLYFEAGMATVTTLLEAETELKQARERFAEAYGNYRTALSAYLIATGR